MDVQTIIEIVRVIAYVGLGFLAIYFKKSEKLKEMAVKLIKEAELTFDSSTKTGGEKFEYVVTTLYGFVPAPLKFIMTRDMVSTLVQNTFNEIEEYATKQLDKVVDGIATKVETEKDKNVDVVETKTEE